MNEADNKRITDSWILSERGPKNAVDPEFPYAWFVEPELTHKGTVEDTGIIFLTNRECPFHCLMCDLWKNTTNSKVPAGSVSRQIERALEKMPGIKHVKLYNSGSFFDENAISSDEYADIAELLEGMETVIVESHPAFIGGRCITFRKMLKADLHVAIGLEVASDDVLRKLNKRMIMNDFRSSVNFLTEQGVLTRAFILLRPPFMTEDEGVYWAEYSLKFAFDSGVECCTVIPVRGGNGAMDELERKGFFTPPEISSLEKVLTYGIELRRGRVFADTWDLQYFSKCSKCFNMRKSRIERMNLSQKVEKQVECECL